MYQDYTVGIGGSCDVYDPPYSPWCSGQFYLERQFPEMHTRHPSGFRPNTKSETARKIAHGDQWKIMNGALAAGGDLETGNFTLAAAEARCAELEPSMVQAVRGADGGGGADGGAGLALPPPSQQIDGRAQVDGFLEARYTFHRRAALLEGIKMGQLQPSAPAPAPSSAAAAAFPAGAAHSNSSSSAGGPAPPYTY